MFLTNHTLTGVAIGLNVTNPAIAAPAALASHLALDVVPHFGHPDVDISRGIGLKLAIVDGLISSVVYIGAINIWPNAFWPISLSAFFATLPDLLYIPRFFWGWVPSKAFARFHNWIQWGENPYGVLTELAWLAAIGYFLTRS